MPNVTVTMLETRLGEDGQVWVAGGSYNASENFARVLITSNLATGTLPEPDKGINVLGWPAGSTGGGGGSGDVLGPSSATDGAVALYDGTTGKLLKNGAVPGTAYTRNVPATGDAASSQVVLGSDTRLTDARTPTSHTHPASAISDSTTAGRALLTAADASAQRTSLGLGGAATLNVGTTTGTVAAGDDSRLTDARTPTAHKTSHATGGSDALTPADIGAAAAGAATGSGLTIANNKILGRTSSGSGALEEISIGSGLSMTSGTLSATGAGGSGDVVGPSSATNGAVALYDGTTGKLLKNGAVPGTAYTKNVPATGDAASGEVVLGNDTRLTDARTPTSHTHPASAISDSTTAGRALLTAADAAAQRTSLGLGGAAVLSVGTTTGTVAAGDDSRLTDSRTPTAHKTSHATGGSDALTPADIGAAAASHTQAASTISDSTAAGRALLTAADASAQRTSLGLGTAATAATTDFAAASHTQAASTISDSTAAGRALLTAADASAQRTSLGLGGAATLNVGTTAGTVAAGDDVRFNPGTIQAAIDYMMSVIAPSLLPMPQRVNPYTKTGTVYYVDPGAAGGGTGTFASPYNTATAATLAAGDALLFKEGTTTTLSAALTVAVTGTSTAPIIIGVYNATDGNRVFGKLGAATLSCGSGAFAAISLASRNYVEVSCIKITNVGTGQNGISVTGTSGAVRIRYCDVTLAATTGVGILVDASGGSNVVCSNKVSGGDCCIQVNVKSPADNSTVVQFNRVSSGANRGIWVYDEYNALKFNGTIAANTVELIQTTQGGIETLTGGGAMKIYRNTIDKCFCGVRSLTSAGGETVNSDFSGTTIENNVIRNCQFGVTMNGFSGAWVIQGNRIYSSGSYNNVDAINTNYYGRAIELFGYSETLCNRDGAVRYNYCTKSFNWGQAVTPYSEGCGIGIDDKSRNIDVYGNVCYQNQGNGIQVNVARDIRVFGNLCVDNVTGTGGTWDVRFQSDIMFANSPNCEIFNNTVVQTGRTNQVACISDSQFDGKNAKIYNNLCIGASLAGVRYGGTTTESYNVVVGSPNVAVNMSSTPVSAGTGSSIQTSGAVGARAPLYIPVAAGPCDNAGTGVVMPGATSFEGSLLHFKTPIGAWFPKE